MIAGRGDDIGGLGRARMGRVDDEKLARQRVRLQRRGLGTQRPDPHVMQRQPSPHVGLVDEPQHRRPVLVGHQQPQPHAAQHLFHRDPPAGLIGAQVHQLGHIRQGRRVDPEGRADLVAHREGELGQRRTDLLDAAQLLGGLVAGHAGGLLGVLGVGRGLPVALHPGQQLGSLGEQLLAQVPELLRAAGHLQPLSEDEILVGAAPPRYLLGLGLGGGHLGLQRSDARARTADLGVDRIRLGLGQIQRAGDVLVLVVELVDSRVELGDLGGALRHAHVVGERPHHRRVHQVDDAQIGGLRGVAVLDGLDVAEDLAFALRDGQQLAGLHQRVDLLERLGQPGEAVGFVEHELADELLQSADALEGFGLAE